MNEFDIAFEQQRNKIYYHMWCRLDRISTIAMNIMERFLHPKITYKDLHNDEKLSDGEDSDLLQGTQLRRSPHCIPWPILLLYTTTAVLVVALVTVTSLYLRLAQVTLYQEQIGCGNTLEEARAAGCTFDILSKSWLRPECPRYGNEEYIAASKDYNISHWQYFTDPEGNTEFDHQKISFEVNNKPGETWSWAGTDREHMVHCAWIVLRLAHAYNKGDRVDTLSANFPHTKHCTLQLLHKAMLAPNIDEISTRGDIVFSSC